ncbi:hypothetical protein O9G_002249 [Rozella allomycis CSF55]|uniref:L domain-like protein n=1 Tax=Rozella allomycis (strain CSF55) TaxID=988480 RepID=A0A075B1F3_ROZAC|nr:hypothetical protein O9G_002249 [Rozella allomycis CSF55]|eukprot:EPZ36183.1 hypothetical protein O9G_002249 [Rozella allomycis CSF55]
MKQNSEYFLTPLSFLVKDIQSLRLDSKNIKNIPPYFKYLSNVKELYLNGNSIATLDNVPLNVVLLSLNYNGIHKMLNFNRFTKISRLFLSRNQLQELPEGSLPCTLLSLDLSFNSLNNLERTCQVLSSLQKLRVLCLQGNFFSLCKIYRDYVCSKIKSLSFLDDIEVNYSKLVPFDSEAAQIMNELQLEITFSRLMNLNARFSSDDNYE